MRYLFSVVFLSLISLAFTQKYTNFRDSTLKWHMGFTVGYSGFGGYACNLDYGINWKLNNVRLAAGLQSELGNRKKDFIAPVFYNDKFYTIDLLYGRKLQYKRLILEMDLGFDLYLYKDKSLEEVYGFLTTYAARIDVYNGLGLTGRCSSSFLIARKTLLGLESTFYYNSNIFLMSAGLKWMVLF